MPAHYRRGRLSLTDGQVRKPHIFTDGPLWVILCLLLLHNPAAADPVPLKDLPAPVQDMHDLITSAVKSGRIEELRTALEWNEMRPDLGGSDGPDQIAALKKASGDGEGRQILAALAEILDSGPAAVPLGRDLENNRIYVWPYLAERPLDKLTAAEEVELLRLVSPEQAKAMRTAKKWTWWRLAIGADGTWQSFRRDGP